MDPDAHCYGLADSHIYTYPDTHSNTDGHTNLDENTNTYTHGDTNAYTHLHLLADCYPCCHLFHLEKLVAATLPGMVHTYYRDYRGAAIWPVAGVSQGPDRM